MWKLIFKKNERKWDVCQIIAPLVVIVKYGTIRLFYVIYKEGTI